MAAAVPIFWDGFDHYNTAAIAQKWNGSTTGGATAINTTAGRRGTGALVASLNEGVSRILPTALSAVIMGCACKLDGTPVANTQPVFSFGDAGNFGGGNTQLQIVVDANLAVRVYRGAGSTLLGTSANAVVPTGAFFYLEARVLVSDTVGVVKVNVNGVEVLSLTSQDTKQTSNTTISQVGLVGASTVSDGNQFDDFYCADATTNTDFLGDQRVDTGLPVSDGFYLTWTPSGGSQHFALIDDVPQQIVNNIADGTAANKDTFNVTDLTAITGVIAGVQITAYAKKSDAGARSLKLVTRSNTTDVSSAAQALSTGETFFTAIQLTDPNTAAAWTESGFNAAQFGVETV